MQRTLQEGTWNYKRNGVTSGKNQSIATLIEHGEIISGYAAGIGIFGHAVAKSNEDLIALIVNASTDIIGPGFFVPA